MVFSNGTDTNEQQSRLISGAITGVFLDGDDLTTTNGQQRAHACLTNQAINSVARAGQTFTPEDGNTGSSAANFFSRQDGSNWLVAVFNYTSGNTNETVDLSRAGLPPGAYTVTNLWDGSVLSATNALNVSLNEKQAKLFRLAIPVQPMSHPIILYTKVQGGNLVFGGSNGVANNIYHVVTATNLTQSLTNWAMLSTDSFDFNGGFSVTNAIKSGGRQLFYQLTP